MQRFTQVIAAGVLVFFSGTSAFADLAYKFQFDYGGGAGVSFNSLTNTYTVTTPGTAVDVQVYLYETVTGGSTSVLQSGGEGLLNAGVRLGRVSYLGSGNTTVKITGLGSIVGGPAFTDTSSPNKYWQDSPTNTDRLTYYDPTNTSPTPLAGVLSFQDPFGSVGATGGAVGSDYRILLGTFTFDTSTAISGDQITIRAADLFSNADDTMTWDNGTILDTLISTADAVVVVPEPPSIIALATLCASGGLLWIVRRRRTAAAPKAEPSVA